MSTEKNIKKAKTPTLRKGVVISYLCDLWDSIKVVTVMFTFIFLFFSGIIVAPILSVVKWLYRAYSKYYNWIFDWYASQDSL